MYSKLNETMQAGVKHCMAGKGGREEQVCMWLGIRRILLEDLEREGRKEGGEGRGARSTFPSKLYNPEGGIWLFSYCTSGRGSTARGSQECKRAVHLNGQSTTPVITPCSVTGSGCLALEGEQMDLTSFPHLDSCE